MSLRKDLQELLDHQIIDRPTADRIAQFYYQKEAAGPNRQMVIFGVLGAILVGAGIILIIAHNWDNFPRSAKTTFAFLPLLVGQALCGISLWRGLSTTWREGSSAFLFFAIGASISLISQIYNLPGSTPGFLLVWMSLAALIIYVMQSGSASILYWAGTTFYGIHTYSSAQEFSNPIYYWMLVAAALPAIWYWWKPTATDHFSVVHRWLVPLSFTITLGAFGEGNTELMFVAYMSLFGAFWFAGQWATPAPLLSSGYRVMGTLGTIVMLFMVSFKWFWEEVDFQKWTPESPELWVALGITAVALLLWHQTRKQATDLLAYSFLVFIAAVGLSRWVFFSILLINTWIFILGLLTIREGVQKNHLGLLNFGLIIISILIICRFFDTQFSYVVRGLAFLIVGSGFFGANYWMLKQRSDAKK